MKKLLSLLVVALLATTLVACNKEQEFNFEQEYITVGLEADYPPFNWLETTANNYNHPLVGGDFVAGYDVEVAKFIANELGLELRIKAIKWESLVASLQNNDIDMIIAGMSPTAERKLTINFTDIYYLSNHVVVVSSDSPLVNATSLEDLKGYKGIGQIGTIYADLVNYVAENYGAIEQPVMDSVPLIATAIKAGTTDFTIVEKPVALGLVEGNDDFRIILDVTENIFEVSDEDREIAIGVRKIDDKLRDLINVALAKITETQRETWMEQAVSRA